MIFAGLTGLEGLDLSCNVLTALDLSRFDPFASSLTYLDITGNSFTTAPTDAAVRDKLTNIANLYISEANTECLLPDDRRPQRPHRPPRHVGSRVRGTRLHQWLWGHRCP